MNFPSQYFRAGVGAVIMDQKGLILSLERADIPNAWQLPQGGLEANEEPLKAVLREVAEETAILPKYLDLELAVPELLAYELPPPARNTKMGRGQVQYWFFFRFKGMENVIDVRGGGEFRCWRWLAFERLLEKTVNFRKNVYFRLFEHYRSHFLPGI